jgi:hypothetical protein
MAINYPGPYELEFPYTVNGQVHKARFSCNVQGTPSIGSPSTSINLYTRSGGTVTMDAACSTLWAFLRPLLHTSVSISAPQLFRYAPGTFQRTWVSQMATALANGSNTVAPALATQLTLTFRTGNGGIAKITVLEHGDNTPYKVPLTANPAGSGVSKLAAYAISADSWILGRDDSYLVAPLYNLNGQNEVLFRKRYRQ